MSKLEMRDRFIEILRIPIFTNDGVFIVGERKLSLKDAEILADRLIANGATINNKMFVVKGRRSFGRTFFFNKLIKEAKAEAIKEFAKQVKEELKGFVTNVPEMCEVVNNTVDKAIGDT